MKGLFFDTNKSGKLKVISEIVDKHVRVVFIDTGYETMARVDSVRNGAVKDKLSRSVHGVGFIGDGDHVTSINGFNTKKYLCWQRMLGRCYDRNYIHYNSYKDCTVCDEWHNFQIFASWHDDNYPNDGGSYHLDKDIKIKGNRIYSPNACKFVTRDENIEAAKAKYFHAISPDGECMTIYNLAKFCRENKLNKSNMHKVLTGKNRSCKGWTNASV